MGREGFSALLSGLGRDGMGIGGVRGGDGGVTRCWNPQGVLTLALLP